MNRSTTMRRVEVLSQRHNQEQAAMSPRVIGSYIPEFDGIRAIAIMAVMAMHAFPATFKGGFLGVEVFFVLSGFLITSLLLQEHDRFGRVDFRNFYLRRLLRLLPALVVMLGLTVLAGALWFEHSIAALLLTDAALVLTYGYNWIRAFEVRTDGYFAHAWSLAIEEQFYFLWPPVMVWLLSRVRSRQALAVWLGGAALLATVHRIALCLTGAPLAWLYNGLDVRCDGILMGAAFAMALHSGLINLQSSAWQRTLRLSAIPAVAELLVLIMFVSVMQPSSFLWSLTVTSMITLILIANVLASEKHLLKSLLTNRVLIWLGQRSYGVYLWHYPTLHLLRTSGLDDATAAMVGYSLSLILAEVSFRCVERPALRFKHHFQPRVSITTDERVMSPELALNS